MSRRDRVRAVRRARQASAGRLVVQPRMGFSAADRMREGLQAVKRAAGLHRGHDHARQLHAHQPPRLGAAPPRRGADAERLPDRRLRPRGHPRDDRGHRGAGLPDPGAPRLGGPARDLRGDARVRAVRHRGRPGVVLPALQPHAAVRGDAVLAGERRDPRRRPRPTASRCTWRPSAAACSASSARPACSWRCRCWSACSSAPTGSRTCRSATPSRPARPRTARRWPRCGRLADELLPGRRLARGHLHLHGALPLHARGRPGAARRERAAGHRERRPSG